jgi:hypothetical protein
MRTELTRNQIEFCRENGFLVIEGCLDAGELEEWRRCTEEAVALRLKTVAPDGHSLSNQKDPDAYYAQVFTQCLRLADIHEGMRRLILSPEIGRMGAELAGVEGLRVWHDQALFKPPFGNPTGWHLDVPYWSFDSRDALSIWVALDDATLGNGCMWYVPGSHRTARFDNAGIGQNIGSLFNVYPEWRAIEPVPCPCPAGSVVWHNGLTAHGAGANMTPHPRRAMTCGFMPDGCTFNGKQNILRDDYVRSLSIGDPLDDEVQNPLVWHRSWERHPAAV